MKSYGTIDFDTVAGFKLESGPDFPAVDDTKLGYMFWLRSSTKQGPYIYNGVTWRALVISTDPTVVTYLKSGRPSYVEPVGNVVTSVESIPVMFLTTGNVRNAYLNLSGVVISSTMGFKAPRKAIIKSVAFQTSVDTKAAATIQLRLNKSTTAAKSFILPSASEQAVFDTSILLEAGDEIAIYLACASNISTPCVFLEIGWRD